MTPELHPGANPASSSAPGREHQARIDAALRALGTAEPGSALQGRILTHLAAARLAAEAGPRTSRRVLPHYAARVLGFLSVGILSVFIVGGSVRHSRRVPAAVVAPPVLELPSSGLGAASAVHPAAPQSAPLPADGNARGRSARPRGRARIAPHARKAPGVALPAPSVP